MRRIRRDRQLPVSRSFRQFRIRCCTCLVTAPARIRLTHQRHCFRQRTEAFTERQSTVLSMAQLYSKLTPRVAIAHWGTLIQRPRAEPSLVATSDGNLYGTSANGGGSTSCTPTGFFYLDGCGVVFKVDQSGAINTLHSFSGKDRSILAFCFLATRIRRKFLWDNFCRWSSHLWHYPATR